MHSRAAALIQSLALSPHPEGGYCREVYRSTSIVRPDGGRTDRTALTSIYFLLAAGDVSRWHRVASDEAWHYYEGDPLELWVADGDFRGVSRRMLGPAGEGTQPVQVVVAHEWQAARSTGAYTLVGCTVGPGFEFSDFEMLDSRSDFAAAVRSRHPEAACFI